MSIDAHVRAERLPVRQLSSVQFRIEVGAELSRLVWTQSRDRGRDPEQGRNSSSRVCGSHGDLEANAGELVSGMIDHDERQLRFMVRTGCDAQPGDFDELRCGLVSSADGCTGLLWRRGDGGRRFRVAIRSQVLKQAAHA